MAHGHADRRAVTELAEIIDKGIAVQRDVEPDPPLPPAGAGLGLGHRGAEGRRRPRAGPVAGTEDVAEVDEGQADGEADRTARRLWASASRSSGSSRSGDSDRRGRVEPHIELWGRETPDHTPR